MPPFAAAFTSHRSPAGLCIEANANGSMRRMMCADVLVNLFPGNELEGGPANLYLRRHRSAPESIPLLGPRSPTRWCADRQSTAMLGTGIWQQLHYTIALLLADDAPAWFWHVTIENRSGAPQQVDLVYAQDIGLAAYDMVRLNEYYVSQYVDHTPLEHPDHGWVLASRQNLSMGGRNPWCLIGSLRCASSFATDAAQLHGLATRAGDIPVALAAALPGRRLQQEHSMAVLQDEPLNLAAGGRESVGFFGRFVPDHPGATSLDDLALVDATLMLTSAGFVTPRANSGAAVAATLFSTAPLLHTHDLDVTSCDALFTPERRHEEFDRSGRLLSFFHEADRHVALRAKELHVQRPHGHLLRTGRHLTPDESALTSTVWMNGVFHSMLTQGHVSFNRFLSTTRSYLGLFRSQGLRAFVELEGRWHLLDVPSAFEIAPDECRWIYVHDAGVLEVRSAARSDPHELTLQFSVLRGSGARFFLSCHVALGGDDGSAPGGATWKRDGAAITVAALDGSDMARRFPQGHFRIEPGTSTLIERVSGDELLFVDGVSRQQPYVCVVTAPSVAVRLGIKGRLVVEGSDAARGAPEALLALPNVIAPDDSAQAVNAARMTEILPWFVHNALIHYLSPRGLEQYSGGGWGTRDVTQGPVELLLALGHTAPIRDLLLRVFSAQQPEGDWPQWFMFFERDRNVRAGDSHGDIVFWPLLALAQYLIATGDGALLDQTVRFFDPRGASAGETATVGGHVARALEVIRGRVIGGTALAAYGHGDWNDALQPADPAMREHMCSAWTVTLHYQVLMTLARALRVIGRNQQAAELESSAAAVHADFQRLLLPDGVLAGYALFGSRSDDIRYLLHPRDVTTGVHYSALAMIHAILEDMLTPAQAREHLDLIDTHLSGPDGLRLFDRPMAYHGGPQRFFQRAESATFFGREIGLMYMHAHLRYAQALAHIGAADEFFRALCQANPIAIRDVVPTAALRQANCYYSSSDAAFADRYEASAEYDRVVRGEIALEGGWRVYSSGAGIAASLIVRRFLGIGREFDALIVDPVMPRVLDGLQAQMEVLGHRLRIRYEIRQHGCGVEAVRCNGRKLAMTRDANPHRTGAARMATRELLEHLGSGDNVLEVTVG
jgi:1,2-beta-oligoglucan phosphorylase